jgi:hypothetical protein
VGSHETQQQALEVARLFGVRAFGDAYRQKPDSSFVEELAALRIEHRRPLPSKLTLGRPQEELDEKSRRVMLARLERAQAERGVPLVRAAGETAPNAPAPPVTADTVWSGDFGTLVQLVECGLRRTRTEFVINGCVIQSRHTVVQHARRVDKRGTLDRAALEDGC